MSSPASVARGRRKARALMDDECAVVDKIGETTDPETGEVVDEYATFYLGPCRVKPPGTQARLVEAGEHVLTLRTYIVSLPITAVGLTVGQTLNVTAVHSDGDPDLAGTTLRIRDVAKGTQLTARRLTCEET